MKTFVAYIHDVQLYRFCSRMADALRDMDYRAVFVTHRLSLYRRAKKNGIEARLIRKTGAPSGVNLRRCQEMLIGILAEKSATAFYSAVMRELESLHAASPIDVIFLWNGGRVFGRASRDFAARHGVKILFGELGNLPGKLFVDTKGVNAQSRLAEDVSILDRYDVDPEGFSQWKRSYLEAKMHAHTVPQSRSVKAVNYGTIIDYLGYWFCGAPTNNNRSLLSAARRKLIARKSAFLCDEVDAENEDYVFFPLQVSVDSQILLNSDVDNEQGIRIALQRAADMGCKLFVKPHPAEPDLAYVKRIHSMRAELGFRFVSGNIFAFLRGAKKVITINSTAGLEALLLGKQVEFLGRSFFKELDSEERLARYIQGYLLDIDYFGSECVPREAIEALLGRAGCA